jgi:hypothetical protein
MQNVQQEQRNGLFPFGEAYLTGQLATTHDALKIWLDE